MPDETGLPVPSPEPIVLARYLRRLGQQRLAQECSDRTDGDAAWNKMSLAELTTHAIEAFPAGDVLALAAEGQSTPGAPPLRGFIWSIAGEIPARQVAVSTAIEKLEGDELSDTVDVVSVEEIPQPTGTVCYLLEVHLVEHGWAAVAGTLEPVERHRRVFVSIDPDDHVLTVFAGAAEHADLVGAAIRDALGWGLTLIRLGNVAPPMDLPEQAVHLAPPTLTLLDLVYGRFAASYEVGIATRAWTRPVADPENPDDTSSRKKLENVLYTPDVIRLLTRGDHLYGLSFQMRRPPDEGMKRRGALNLSVTLKDDDLNGLVLTVGGASGDRGRGLPLYDELRRLVLSSEESDGSALAAVVDRIFKDYVPKA